MTETTPTAEMIALWNAEQLWDWRVRLIFASVCVIAALIALGIYMLWGRKRTDGANPRVRRYFGRISVTLLCIAVAERAFFKDLLSTCLLVLTAAAIGLIGLHLPGERQTGNQHEEQLKSDESE